jgi:CRP-like cAMP-binding protein
MTKKGGLSKSEQKDLQKKMAHLDESPDDAMAASRVGFLLNKAGKKDEAASHLWTAFRSFINTGQYSMAVMVADELLSIHTNNVEIMHELSKVADKKDLEVPVLKIYKKYKGFHEIPLFSALSELEFLQLLKASKYHDIKKNKAIIKEGAKGDEIFLIVEGHVSVTKKDKKKKDLLLGTLDMGNFLGEIAYMSDRRRSATVTADVQCQLLSWEGKAIRQLNKKHPQVTEVLYNAFWERSLDMVLSLSPLFSHLKKNKRNSIIKKFKPKSYQPKDVILREGTENQEGALYIIKKGKAAVFSEKKGNFRHPLAMLGVGDIFGEYSVITNDPCTATVMAKTPLDVIMLQRSDFANVINTDKESVRILNEIENERLDEPSLQMSYFKLMENMGGVD